MNSKLKSVLVRKFKVKERNVVTHSEVNEKLFVLDYWLEVLKYKGECKERYKYMVEGSEVRMILEDVFKEYELDRNYVVFRNIGNNEDEKNDKKNIMENVGKYVGLKKRVDGKEGDGVKKKRVELLNK